MVDDAGMTWMRCGRDVDGDAIVDVNASVTWMRCGRYADYDAGVDGDAFVDDDAGVTSKRENELSF